MTLFQIPVFKGSYVYNAFLALFSNFQDNNTCRLQVSFVLEWNYSC